jgi:carbon-monoxide dehydrogenase large subunit
MTIMGTKVLRKEDPAFLTAGATYTADVDDPRLDGAVHLHYVRSTMAHAQITSIETDEAAAAPGVLAVLTAADLADLPFIPAAVPLFPEPMMNRPWLASDVVRFTGEPIAAVVAESPYQAADAAELVFIDYEPLDPAVDLEAAATDGTVVFGEVGTNTALDFAVMGMATGVTDDSFFDGCDLVVRQRVVNNKLAPVPLEGRSAAATWVDGKLIVWISTQAPHGIHGAFQAVYGVDASTSQVIAPDVGGGFGQKIGGTPEEMLLPHVSKLVGRPARWTETRTENMIGTGHGRAQVQQLAIGGDHDGTVKAYRLEVLGDVGAYANMGAFLPFFTHAMSSGVYAIPKIETSARSIVTNTSPTMAYRGAGRPEAAAAVERAIDLFAAEIGMDPVEVRRKNLIGPDLFPYTTAVGTEYDTGDYNEALDRALEAAGYDELRSEQDRRRQAGGTKQLGVGVSVYVEITAGPAPGGNEFAKVEITPEGKARIYSGAFSHGQSHKTTFAMLAADQLGMPMEDIDVIQGDTDIVAQGVGTFGSRSLQLGGSAVYEASGQVADQAKEIAATLLEAHVDDVVLDIDNGQFHVAGTPAVSTSWTEIAANAGDDGLAAESDYNGGASYPFGAHVVVVEVDTETGHVDLQRVITCDDSGTILNPLIVEGQRHGGIAQGVAQALYEEVQYDELGNPVTSNLADYAIPSAAELPSYELVAMETPTPLNVLGAKGIGESGAIGATPAAQNAVVDAVAHLGVRHIDMPTTPQRVWTAIAEAQNG